MIPGLLLNIIQSLVVDKASTLAKEHVEKVMSDNLSDCLLYTSPSPRD